MTQLAIKVTKRDGSTEDFDLEKIKRVLVATGLDGDHPQLLAAKIRNWAENKNKAQVSSQEIRDRVIDELKTVNEYCANLFSWYQKTKERDLKNHTASSTLV